MIIANEFFSLRFIGDSSPRCFVKLILRHKIRFASSSKHFFVRNSGLKTRAIEKSPLELGASRQKTAFPKNAFSMILISFFVFQKIKETIYIFKYLKKAVIMSKYNRILSTSILILLISCILFTSSTNAIPRPSLSKEIYR